MCDSAGVAKGKAAMTEMLTNEKATASLFVRTCIHLSISLYKLYINLTSSSVWRCWSWKTLCRKSRSFSLQSVSAWISSRLSSTCDTAPRQNHTHTQSMICRLPSNKVYLLDVLKNHKLRYMTIK